VATKLRPWLFGLGVGSIAVGFILLWTTSAGWILVVTGALELLASLLTPSITERDQGGIRLAISVGFLILAAFLIRNAADTDEGPTRMRVVSLVGAVASIFVGALGIAKTYTDQSADD
jgi:hypothetical protein